MTSTNINVGNVNNARAAAFWQGGSRGGISFGGNDVVAAIIAQKNAQGITLTLDGGQTLNVREGTVIGEAGDTVYFEVRGADDTLSLRQIFPNIEGQGFLSKMASLANLEGLMEQHGHAPRPSNGLDIAADVNQRIEARRAAGEVASRLARNIGRVGQNVHGAAVAQLAASGINVDKLPVDVLSGVVDTLDAAKSSNQARVYDDLTTKLAAVDGLTNGQIAQVLANEVELTLDSLYVYKHSGAAAAEGHLTQQDWQELQADIHRFLSEIGRDAKADNMERVRFLLENQIPLTQDNFDKLIFLQGLSVNVDVDALMTHAMAADAAGQGLGALNVYEVKAYEDKALAQLKEIVFKYETRLAMSYEANIPLIGGEMEIDLKPQMDAITALKEQEASLLAALKEVSFVNEAAIEKMASTFKAVHTLPYVTMATFGDIVASKLDFSPAAVEQHIASTKYDEQATVASLKYGDTAAKIADQFAPLLSELGLTADGASVRAAKILTANNMEINAENLAKIKDIDAKLKDIEKYLHPRIAAAMVAEGLNPATMHMDDILTFIADYKATYELTDNERLLEHIARMDRDDNIQDHLRQQIMDIYRALNKIMKHDGAGIGYAVNAGIELTLQSLMDFSKTYNVSRGKNNTLNYTAQDGAYYAKHVVSSFVEVAAPKPLAELTQTQPLTDPLEVSAQKLENIAKKLMESNELDMQKINEAIKDLSSANKESLRTLAALGIPVTVANLRHLRTVRERELDAVEAVSDEVPTDPIAANDELTDAIENMLDAAIDAGDASKINQMDIILQNLAFKKMLLGNDRDYSFAMKFNGRIGEVKMHLLSETMDVTAGVTAYLSLSTAMGEVEGLLHITEGKTNITLAADPAAIAFLKENIDLLPDGFDITFKEKAAFKMQLSQAALLPIY